MKRFLIFFLLIALSSATWVLFRSSSTQSIQECDNVFSSAVYANFHRQLTEFLENELQSSPELRNDTKLGSFIERLLAPQPNLRKYHEEWIQNLRLLIRENDNSGFLDRLSRWFITGPILGNSMGDYLFEKFSIPSFENSYAKVIQDYHRKISKEKSFYISFLTPLYDDGFLYGNLPSYLFSLKNSKGTKVIRMANPAKDLPLIKSFFIKPQEGVNEEFLQHIAGLRDEKHLYVNLMKRRGKESKKTQFLESFEAAQGSLILVSLDKDSDFYWQMRNYSSLNDAALFKKAFHQHLFKKGGNYYWSNKLNTEEWANDCKELLEEIHNHYFQSKDALNQSERCDFIELSYLAIINSLVEKFEPQYLNISCRHSMDRGPSLTTLLYVDQLLKQKETLKEYHSQILAMLFSPPLLIHNRCSHSSRIERFTSALERLQH